MTTCLQQTTKQLRKEVINLRLYKIAIESTEPNKITVRLNDNEPLQGINSISLNKTSPENSARLVLDIDLLPCPEH